MTDRPLFHFSFTEALRKTLSNYLVEYRLTHRDELDNIKFSRINQQNDKDSVTIVIEHEPSEGSAPMAKLTLQINEDVQFESLEPTNQPNEALRFLLSSLCSTGIVNPRLERFFAENSRFENHYSIYVLNRPKIGFSWSANDILCVLNSTKVDVFGKGGAEMLSLNQINFERMNKDVTRASNDFEKVFSNETLKLIHVMDLNDAQFSAEEDYLTLMIQSQNKSDPFHPLNLKDSKMNQVVPTVLFHDFLSQLLAANTSVSDEAFRNYFPNLEFEMYQVWSEVSQRKICDFASVPDGISAFTAKL